MAKKIYLACPYWHDIKGIREVRFREVSHAASILMRDGHKVFSPISHSHPIAEEMNDNQDHDFWLDQDYTWLDMCDEVWVLTLQGYKESFGVKEEVYRALEFDKPVKLIAYETLLSW